MEYRTVAPLLAPLAVLVPLAGAAAVPFLARLGGRARDAVLTAACLLTAGLALGMVPPVLEGTLPPLPVARMTPTIRIVFRADAMGVLFGVTAAVLWLLVMLYSPGYMADEHRRNRYYAFFMLNLGWTMGISFAGNLLTFFVFYELFSILTYPLVVHEQTPEAMAAGVKYIVYILIGGSLLLLSVMVTFFLAGSQPFGETALLSTHQGRSALLALFWCFVLGFGVKAAIFPLHGWVPDVHPAAPTPFSAVLSGVMVAAGSFGILRVFYNVFGADLLGRLGVTPWLGFLAALTVIFAAVMAVGQDDLKRRLAYSTISQMGYVILGAAVLEREAAAGAMVHVTNHAFMKGALFLCAGILIKRARIRRVSDMGGIASRFPLTMAVFTLCALGMIGMPPLSGFISKWYLGLGMIRAGRFLDLAVLLGGALLAAVYLLPVVYTAYFGGTAEDAAPEAGAEGRRAEAPWTMLAAVLSAAAITLLIGAAASWPGMPLVLARLAAGMFFP